MIQIQRLNMDNSWFINLNGTGILVDPWLLGKGVDFFPWFNTQWHRTQPIDLDKLPEYDLVLVTQKYPDHFHKETLLKLQPAKMIVPASIEKTCKKWLPEAEVIHFNDGLKHPFGTNINLHFLPTRRKIDPIYDALILEDGHQSIFLASHGFSLDEEQTRRIHQLPPVELLITPFNLYQLPAFLGGTVSPGMESVRQLIKAINPNRVVPTHDEDKHAKGLVPKLAKITWAPPPAEIKEKEFIGERFLHIDHYKPVAL